MYHEKLYKSGATLPRLVRAEFGLPLWGLKILQWITLGLMVILGTLTLTVLYVRVFHPGLLPVWDPVIVSGSAFLVALLWHRDFCKKVGDAEFFLTPVKGYDLTKGPFREHLRAFQARVDSRTAEDAEYLCAHATEHTHTVYVFWRLMRTHVGEA